MKTTKATVKNIKLHASYGVSGVEIHLNLQELFQLSMKRDILGQHIGWLLDQQENNIPQYALAQLEELSYFLDNILQSAGFETKGRAEIFSPVPPTTEEEDQ